MKITPEQSKLTHEELKKDVLARHAISILQQIDPSIELEWVKEDHLQAQKAEFAPGVRRVIQMKG